MFGQPPDTHLRLLEYVWNAIPVQIDSIRSHRGCIVLHWRCVLGAAKLTAVAGEMYSTSVACAVYMAGSAMLTAGAGLTYSTNAAGAEHPAGAGEVYFMTGPVSA